MQILFFLGFFLVSYILLLQIMRFSTYHKYFLYMLPPLMIYAFLAGYLLYHFGLSDLFIWYVIFMLILFSLKKKKEKKLMGTMESLTELTKSDPQFALIKKSGENSLKYFTYSAIVYLVIFSISFLYFYN